MPKPKSLYVCGSCGYESPHWVGQCPECKSWNTFSEEVIIPFNKSRGKTRLPTSKPVYLSKISAKSPERISSKIGEFDRVLGGGFVPGQVVLLGGSPGIGKSTLVTEIAKQMSTVDILYICGEESPDQIKLRADRMHYSAKNLLMLSETNVDAIVSAIEDSKGLGFAVIDSIQTLYSEDFAGTAGSISQIKGCTQILTNTAKRLGVPLVLIGHITKEGVVAGPKILEHVVDTVLYLEGDSQYLYRLLRTTKNRFGPVSEVGIFEMTEGGMTEVLSPSDLFLSQTQGVSSGSCLTVIMEGYRPILFEVQALTVRTAFGYPRRTTSGFSNNRLLVLIAILEKRAGLDLSAHDVYLSVAGGFKINEYAADLAVCLAIASSIKDKPIKSKTVAFGECGLSGEVRKVPHLEKRVKEAKKLGYKNIIDPGVAKNLKEALKLAF